MNQTLYAYLNITLPMVAWEVAIGRIRSACDINLKQHEYGISLWQYNLIRKYVANGISNRFRNELSLELIRQRKFSTSVSRLRGVYFFKSEKDAYAAVDRWGVPENRKFISAVNFSSNNTTFVDSEWITSFLASDEEDWMERYWRGETLGAKPLTEVLSSGIGLVQNKELRKQAYEKIIHTFPYSTRLLAIATCGIKYAKIESIAQAMPFITQEDARLKISFYLNIGDLNKKKHELMKACDSCKENNEYPLTIKPLSENVVFHTPDLTDDASIKINRKLHQSIR